MGNYPCIIMSSQGEGWVLSCVCDWLCAYVCPCSKTKTPWAINMKAGTDMVHGKLSSCQYWQWCQKDKVTGLSSANLVGLAWYCMSIRLANAK